MSHITFNEIRRNARSQKLWFSIFYWCSAHVVWLSVRLGITPNQLTCSGLVLNFVSAAYFQATSARSPDVLITAASFAFAHVVDCADGHLAYVTNSRSRRGQWLDSTLDLFSSALMVSCFLKLLMTRDLIEFGSYANWIKTTDLSLRWGPSSTMRSSSMRDNFASLWMDM